MMASAAPSSSSSKRRTIAAAVGAVLIIAAVAIYQIVGRHEPAAPMPAPSPSAAPISSRVHEGLVAFVKYTACEPTSCDAILCEPFSDGQTRGSPARIVRCRWLDSRAAPDPQKCGYVHFMGATDAGSFSELHLSARIGGATCQADPAFNERIKTLGYSGRLP